MEGRAGISGQLDTALSCPLTPTLAATTTAVDPLLPGANLFRHEDYPTHNLRLFLPLCGLDIGVYYNPTDLEIQAKTVGFTNVLCL